MGDPSSGYSNPVIPGFHPDPSVCRVGDDYYLVTSTFTYFPGVPILHSRNLVDWTQIGNVLDRPSQLDFAETRGWSSLGIYAPTIRHHDGRFWMITTNVTNLGTRSFFVTAEDPAGPWSDPAPIAINGVDPDLAWVDGECWVHHSDFGIVRVRIDETNGELLSEPERTWSGTGLQYPEAPHVFERDGTWYLLIAEGGTRHGHAVSIARGPSILGPWEGCPSNPIVSHRSTDRPIQATGHADLVEATDGSWWMILLGVRSRGIGSGFHVLGRETFLAPVDWRDGWPEVASLDLEMPTRPPGPKASTESAVDDFDSAALAPTWMAVRRLPDEISSLASRPGWLTVAGTTATLDDEEPVLVARRQQHQQCRVRTLVDADPSVEAGLTVYMDETSHYEVAVQGDQVVARARLGTIVHVLGASVRPDGPVVLRVETRLDPHGPDVVVLGFESGAGAFQELGSLDGRYLSTEVIGGFTGRVIGMYAVGGDAAFDWFDYSEAE